MSPTLFAIIVRLLSPRERVKNAVYGLSGPLQGNYSVVNVPNELSDPNHQLDRPISGVGGDKYVP